MTVAVSQVPKPSNEPVRAYAPGSPERASLEAEVARQAGEVVEIPCVVGGREVFTGRTIDVRNPCDHAHVLAHLHLATPELVQEGIQAALGAKAAWAALPWEERASLLLRAAARLAGPWRDVSNAATMLGQGKTMHQAEIDSACELIDFWRFNAWYAQGIYEAQPPENSPGVWNRLDHRPLDGFVFAVTPFNFTAIALNLPTAPALMGNTVVWKPSPTSALACWKNFQLLRDAGLPDGVINLVNGLGADVGDPVLEHPDLGGIHFTGSTGTFQHFWKTVGGNIGRYRQYPRLVGETGGKDFIVAHPSADAETVAVAILRGSFEFQGQKCSAASRVYLPASLYEGVKDRVVAGLADMVQGDVREPGVFVGAVIDERAFDKIAGYVDLGRAEGEVLAGGGYDKSRGWFVEPTVVRVPRADHPLMAEEIFGPVVSIFVYEDAAWSETLDQVDATSPYALTGAVFARDRAAVVEAQERLRFAAGNFYVNDKPTGAVVGQQPFGGGRASGTNDKAGSPLNLLRWVSPRAIKENLLPPSDWRYPFLG